MKKNNFINLSSVRREDQKQIMEQINQKGHCPFCPDNLIKYHKKPILKNGKYWILTDNQWPYDKTKHQLLAIYKEHVEHLTEINPEAGTELIEMFQAEAVKRNIPGGGIAIRFGSNPLKGNYGNSVLHLHAHMIEPDLEALDKDEAWRLKFGQPNDYSSNNVSQTNN